MNALADGGPTRTAPLVAGATLLCANTSMTTAQHDSSSAARRLERRTKALQRLLSSKPSKRRHAMTTTHTNSGGVLFVVIAHAGSVRDRALLQHRTWCQSDLVRSVQPCAFMVDDPSAARLVDPRDELRMVHLSNTNVPHRSASECCANASSGAAPSFFCERHRMRTLDAQYRYLPALRWAKRELASLDESVGWVALVDDDSFVFPRGLARILGRLNASLPLHIGDFWRDQAEGGASLGRPQYACGGGGSVFSRAAMERMDVSGCIARLHTRCSQSDWMVGECARWAGVHFVADHGCTCVEWRDDTERRVREGLHRGSCAFLQFPNSPGARGGPFKDLVPLLRNMSRAGLEPAIVHQLDRLV